MVTSNPINSNRVEWRTGGIMSTRKLRAIVRTKRTLRGIHLHVFKDVKLIALAAVLFGVGFWVHGEHLAAGIVLARVIEAIGDVLFDRGIA
jgi:hypothetical protein